MNHSLIAKTFHELNVLNALILLFFVIIIII